MNGSFTVMQVLDARGIAKARPRVTRNLEIAACWHMLLKSSSKEKGHISIALISPNLSVAVDVPDQDVAPLPTPR